jgi:hypothetical protein
MSSESPDALPSTASWIAVALAWLLVGTPLLWGVFITLEKAAPLFR